MTIATALARTELEGWLVLNVGSAEAEEAWRLVAAIIDAERDAVIEANAALRESWKLASTKYDVETFSRGLAEKLLRQWSGGNLPKE
jgi:hypothetical protein